MRVPFIERDIARLDSKQCDIHVKVCELEVDVTGLLFLILLEGQPCIMFNLNPM